MRLGNDPDAWRRNAGRDPARILPPDRHDEIWAIQEPLDFPRYVFGVERPPPGGTFMPEVMPRYAAFLRRAHAGDQRPD